MPKRSERRKIVTLLHIVVLVICILILFSILILFFLKLNIIHKIIPAKSVVNLKAEKIVRVPNDHLKYFYEPEPNTINRIKPDWLSKEIINNINNDGLNSNSDYAVNKPTDTFRIITVGDSFTYGLYVNTTDNFSFQLEKLLNGKKCPGKRKFEVINLGVGGYDAEYTLERFLTKGKKYKTDLVIWLLNYWNLLFLNEYKIPLEKEYIDHNVPSFNVKTGIYEAVVGATDDIIKKYGKEYIFNYHKKAFDRFWEGYNGKMMIVSFRSFPPEGKKVVTEMISGKPQILFIDTLGDKTGLESLPDGHPNSQGHKRIADDLKKYLLENYLMQCT